MVVQARRRLFGFTSVGEAVQVTVTFQPSRFYLLLVMSGFSFRVVDVGVVRLDWLCCRFFDFNEDFSMG